MSVRPRPSGLRLAVILSTLSGTYTPLLELRSNLFLKAHHMDHSMGQD